MLRKPTITREKCLGSEGEWSQKQTKQVKKVINKKGESNILVAPFVRFITNVRIDGQNLNIFSVLSTQKIINNQERQQSLHSVNFLSKIFGTGLHTAVIVLYLSEKGYAGIESVCADFLAGTEKLSLAKCGNPVREKREKPNSEVWKPTP